jgi:tetratricopeptide (TPR) repeat protein
VSGNRAARRRQGAPAAEIIAAAEHYRAGRLDKAEALCRKALQKTPDDINALHLLGVVSLERGHPERAIQLIGRALARNPRIAQAHGNLGNAYRAAGRREEADASYRRAIALEPNFAQAHANLGFFLYEQGDFTAALTSCRRAAELDPHNPQVLTNLGNVHRALGQLEMAEAILRRAVSLRPENADHHVNLGNVLMDLKRFEEAEACFRRAIALDPGLARAHYGFATRLGLAGDMEAAIASYREVLAASPGEKLAWNDLGRAMRALGRFEEAGDAFRRALDIDPDFADAYRNLAACRQLAADEGEIARLTALAARPELPIEDRAAAGFAVGKALDDAERFDDAFAAYAEANRLYREARAAAGDRFDAEALRQQVDATMARYTRDYFASVARWGSASEVPVFVLGMPRSGTSLVEQIAASHSRVFGAGELRDIGELAAELGPAPEEGDVRRLADAHLARLRALGSGAERVIDKMPDNVFKLGEIATLFPGARVVFCRRDPRDICLSCYFQKFTAGQLTFSYDLADCARRYRETERLAGYWRGALPLRMIEIEYEALVADLEGEARRLIEFLGLDWERACLDFHRTQRTVMTASSWQVRQPLYDRSVGRWRHYEPHLGPLFAALETAEAGEGGLAAISPSPPLGAERAG